MTMKSSEGVTYDGRYRFGREDSGLMQIHGPENEVLLGSFDRVGRTAFVENYEKAFGRGTIELDGPDLSRHGGTIGGVLGSTSGFHETAYADPPRPPRDGRASRSPGHCFIGCLAARRSTHRAWLLSHRLVVYRQRVRPL